MNLRSQYFGAKKSGFLPFSGRLASLKKKKVIKVNWVKKYIGGLCVFLSLVDSVMPFLTEIE